MITVNAGSNDLTLFPNFGAGQSIGTGGNTPLAAVAADFNHDGIMDLLVANNGDAYVFPEGGGGTYPYAQAPGKTAGSGLPAAQKTSNALEQGDGTLKAR